MKIVCRKSNGALLPVDEEGIEALAKVRDGRDVMVEFKQARNPRFHRLYWALIAFIKLHAIDHATGDSLFETADVEMIHIALKLATGLVKTFVDNETGRAISVPLSINFESMDGARFAEFFDAAVLTITRRWLPPGTLADDVRRTLIELVDGPGAIGERVA